MKSDYIYAPPIKQGDKIGYFSPSAPITASCPVRYQRARDYLQSKGFHLATGTLTGQSDVYRSGTAKARAEELNQLIRDPNVRVIMSTIGGTNSNALLPYIDYDAIRADPKVIIGYSDVTSILLGIYQQTGLITFYGPALVASLGEFPPLVDVTFNEFSTLLAHGGQTTHQYTMPFEWTDEMIPWDVQDRAKICQPNRWRFLGKGIYKGRVIAGNLNTIWSIWGSPYMPEIQEGDILLIEDSLKDIATVERLFTFLKLNGIYQKISALVLGKHEGFNHRGTNREPLDVLYEVLDDIQLPILADFDCCHTHPMLTVPIGVEMTIDFDTEQIEVSSSWLCQ